MSTTTEYCYIHKGHIATKHCDRCGYPICDDCASTYWHTNAISAMFQPQKREEQELFLCKSCLKTTRIRNGLITGFMLILILGMIAFFISSAAT